MTAAKARAAGAKRPRGGSAQPGEIAASAAAERLGLTKQAIGIWTKRPGAPVRIDGARVWVQWPAFARWREDELVRQRVDEATRALRAQLDSHGGDPMLRKLRADARKAEIEVELLERSVVRVEDADAEVGQLLTDLRAALLPFARVAAPKVLGAKTVVELEQRLHAQIVRLMEQLAAPSFGGDTPAATEEAA